MVEKNKPPFGGIIETHVKQPKIQKFIDGILPGWNFAEYYGFSDIGKIWVVWHPSVTVTTFHKSLQSITSEVWFPNHSTAYIVTIIYASNYDDQRLELWKELISLSDDQRISGKPWIVLEDFNQTLHPEEHFKPSSLNIDAPTRLFRETLLEADLADLTCPLFTWTNKSKTNLIAKKLDRVLVNDEWLTLIPGSIAVFGEPDFSDHAVCGVLQPEKNDHSDSTTFCCIMSSFWIISQSSGIL